MFKSNHISYFRNLTDVTLAYEDTNSILTDKVNMTIQGNVAMQVTQSGGQVKTYASDLVETKMM